MELGRDIARAFRAHSLRCTPQRYAVLEYLMRRPVHATAEQIFRAVNRGDPRSSRATVYNTLHALVRARLVREVVLDGKAARYDANLERHHHFVCERCGRVEDIDWFALPDITVHPALRGRAVRTCEAVFRGLCSRCGATDLEDQHG